MKVELSESLLLVLDLVTETVKRVFAHRGSEARLLYLNFDSVHKQYDETSEEVREVKFEGRLSTTDEGCQHIVRGSAWLHKSRKGKTEALAGKIVCGNWEWFSVGKVGKGNLAVTVKTDPSYGFEI